MKIGLVLLAAGASKRLGHPKQLISFKGKTLLQHAIDNSLDLNLSSRVLILGASAQKIVEEVDTHSFEVFINKDWEEGMASSLRMGIEKSVEKQPNLNGILILVADQPFISAELLQEMIGLYKSEKSIVVCQYGDVKGVPALFGCDYFSDLMKLEGDQGAKKIIMAHPDQLATITFDQGTFDIDTPEDLERLKEHEN